MRTCYEEVWSRDVPFPQFIPSLQSFLKNTAFSQLTFLALHHVPVSPDALMSLVHLPRLGGLFVSLAAMSPVIDDRDIRNWGRAIQEKAAFPELRVLVWRPYLATPRFSRATFLEACSHCPDLLLVRYEPDPGAARTIEVLKTKWRDHWERVGEGQE